jgi:hypothetical protein
MPIYSGGALQDKPQYSMIDFTSHRDARAGQILDKYVALPFQ